MESNDKYLYWQDIAEYDLATAESMRDSGRWLYVVFMCQQAIEKLCKGLYILYIDDNPPRTHNINIIFGKYLSKLPCTVSEDKLDLFDKLTAHYLNGRYPEYKEKLSNSVDEETANQLLSDTKEAFEWLLTLKP